MKRLRKYLPDREQIARNQWLRWLGPSLLHPRLWHFSRRGVAVGVALGVFFGLLIPIAQIPMAAGAAIVLRANVPAAVGSTLVTNPLTFAPIYVLAYKAGAAMLGESVPTDASIVAVAEAQTSDATDDRPWWRAAWERVASLGKPLLLGLSTFAVAAGVLTYLVIMLAWRLRTVLARRRRLRSGKRR